MKIKKGLLFLIIAFGLFLTGCKFFSESNYHKVIFYNEDVKLKEQVVKDGTPMVEVPVVSKDKYIFLGWDYNDDGEADELPEVIEQDYIFKALFKKQGEVKIDFVNYNDELIVSLFFDPGEQIVYSGPTPEKEPTERYVYVFDGWDKELGVVSGPETYKALFHEEDRLYNVTVYDYEGKIVSQKRVKYGSLTPIPEAQSKEADETYTYRFLGYNWTGGTMVEDIPATVTKDINLYPIYKKTYIEYTIKFTNDGVLLNKVTLHYGDKIVYPEMENQKTAYGYGCFIGWDKNDDGKVDNDTNVTGNDTYEALYQWEHLLVMHINDEVIIKCYSLHDKVDLTLIDSPSGYRYTWYSDSDFITPVEIVTIPDNYIEVYAKVESVIEMYTKVLDFNPDSKINSREDLLVLFDYLILKQITKYTARLSYSPSDINAELAFLIENSTVKDTYSVGTSYSPLLKDLTFEINYEIKNTTESVSTHSQLPSLTIIDYPNSRGEEFNSFYIDKVKKTFECDSSEQLYYVLEHGYRPIIKNDKLNSLYDKIKDTLRLIIDDNMNDYEKVTAIYDWLVNEVDYDTEVYNLVAMDVSTSQYHCFYLEGVFDYHLAVCDGIAKAFAVMCNIEGIPAIKVSGVAKNGGIRHAWNKVLINNAWYIVDCTSGGTIVNGTNEVLTHKFLLIDEDTYAPYYIEEVNSLKDFKAIGKYNYYEYKEVYDDDGTPLPLICNDENDLYKVIKYLYKYGSSTTTIDCYLNFDYGDSISDEVQRALNKIFSTKNISYFNDRGVFIAIMQ